MYMDAARELVKMTVGQTGVNPPVGAIIVKDGEIVGIGAHLKDGDAHAEVQAIRMAKEKSKHATIYVTLEPCSHYGKTPPCVDAIIEARIKRVIFSVKDRSLKGCTDLMKDHGIEVIQESNEALEQFYAEFFHGKQLQVPITTVKVSSSLDGKVANDFSESKWITNKRVKEDVFKLRHRHDAIITGYQTIKKDNPKLTTRLRDGKSPTPVILSRGGIIDFSLDIFKDDSRNIIIITENKRLRAPYTHVTVFYLDKCNVENILKKLYASGFGRVLVEAGPNVTSQFLNSDLVLHFTLYYAPKLIGGSGRYQFFQTEDIVPLHESKLFTCIKTEHIEDNLKLTFKKEI